MALQIDDTRWGFIYFCLPKYCVQTVSPWHACRWITPFRAVWGPGADFVAVGNMKRGVDMYDASTGRAVALLGSEFMTAIPSRLTAHPHLPVIAAATSSGRVHVFRC